MDKELITRYAPFILIVFAMFFQYKLFVTPQELEIQHREILEEVSIKYMTKEESHNLKEQISDMQNKVDKIYDAIIGGKEWNMELTKIEYGSLASSKILNDNFNFLETEISDLAENLTNKTANFSSQVATLNFNVENLLKFKQTFIQTGMIIPTVIPEVPLGFLLCDGSEVSKTEYPYLYASMGDLWGTPNSSSNFKLPNLAGNVPVGYNSADTDFAPVGHTGGEKTHKLTIAEMPSHSHSRNYYSADWCANGTKSGYHGSDTGTKKVTGSTGGNGAHNNLQPYAVVKYIICAF